MRKTAVLLLAICIASCGRRGSDATDDKEPSVETKEPLEDVSYTLDKDATTSVEAMEKFIANGEINVERMYQYLGRPIGINEMGNFCDSFLYFAPPDKGYYISFDYPANYSPFDDEYDFDHPGYIITGIWTLKDGSHEPIPLWRISPEDTDSER